MANNTKKPVVYGPDILDRERFPVEVPNIVKVKIPGVDVSAKGIKPRIVETRVEVRSRRAQFVMDRWRKKHPEWADINYEAVIEAGNRVTYVGKWLAEVNAEFSATTTFPNWAAAELGAKSVDRIIATQRNVGQARREAAIRDMQIAKKVEELRKQNEDHMKAQCEKYMRLEDGSFDWEAFIFTYPANQLPLLETFKVIAYTAEDATLTNAQIKELGDKYISPSMYEDSILDDFKKELWKSYKKKEVTVEQYLKSRGVNFMISGKELGDEALSGILRLIENRDSSGVQHGHRG